MKVSLIGWELLHYLAKCDSDDGRVLRIDGEHIRPFGRLSTHGRYSDFTVHLRKAVAECLAKGLLVKYVWPARTETTYPDYVLSEEAKKIAAGIKPPAPKAKLPELSFRDWSVFRKLSESWQSPLGVGGHNGSHHSSSLKKLCAHGLAETRGEKKYPRPASIFKRAKGSNRYRLTKKGMKLRENTLALTQRFADCQNPAGI